MKPFHPVGVYLTPHHVGAHDGEKDAILHHLVQEEKIMDTKRTTLIENIQTLKGFAEDLVVAQ